MLLFLKSSSDANQVKVRVSVEIIWVILHLPICALTNREFHDREIGAAFSVFLLRLNMGDRYFSPCIFNCQDKPTLFFLLSDYSEVPSLPCEK